MTARTFFRGLLLTLTCGLWLQSGSAQTISVTHCAGECPRHESQLTNSRSSLVIHHLYAAGINGETGMADWVAYRLTPAAVGVASLLPRSWQADRLIRFSPLEDIVALGEEELSLSEVARESASGYGGAAAQVKPEDRARLAPITSFANTPYWSDLNNFSNMVPMPSPLRLGAWLHLEQSLNRLVQEKEDLYVIAGPLFIISKLNLNPSTAELNPAAYFKVVVDAERVAAFAFPEDLDQFKSYCEYRVEYSELQQMAGIELFPGKRSLGDSADLYHELGCSR